MHLLRGRMNSELGAYLSTLIAGSSIASALYSKKGTLLYMASADPDRPKNHPYCSTTETQSLSERIRVSIKHTLRALQYRNYKLYFFGQGVSLIGSWMQSTALSWLVYRLTGSALLLGTVAFMTQIPSLLLCPIGGVVADRFDRRKVLMVTQATAMMQAFTLSLLVLTKTIAVWHILTLGVVNGLVFAFDSPARQSFIVDMTEDRDIIGNAIALNSTIFNSARIVGPSVAGILIAIVGEGMCFFLNGVSYLAVLGSLVLMQITPRDRDGYGAPILQGFVDGFKYVAGSPPIRSVLLLLALISLMAMPYSVLMPIFAKNILGGDSHTYGGLLAASGVGALTGAIYLASRRSVVGLTRWIAIAATIFGFGLIAFALSKVIWLSSVLLAVAAFGMVVQMASSNTVIQTITEEDKRGRVMAFYTMAFMGTAPFGSILSGVLANSIGPVATVIIGGTSSILAAAAFASRLPKIESYAKPIFEQMGLIGPTD